MLSESLDQFGMPVLEGISDILFHKTGDAAKILTSNEFKLTFAQRSDTLGRPSDKWFYLSTARSPVARYQDTQTLVLDGRKLAQRYSGGPMDYWGPEFRKASPSSHEMEDRIWSRDQIIPDAKDYIKEVHVYINSRITSPAYQKTNRTIAKECKKAGIPVFFYDDKKAYELLNRAKAVKPEFSVAPPKEDDAVYEPYPGVIRKLFVREPQDSYVDSLVKLYWMKPEELQNSDSDESLKAAYKAYRNISGIDQGRGVASEIANDKRSTSMQSLAKVMRHGGFKDTKELFDFIREKFKDV